MTAHHHDWLVDETTASGGIVAAACACGATQTWDVRIVAPRVWQMGAPAEGMGLGRTSR